MKHMSKGIYLSQPHLINQIFEDINIFSNAPDKLIPAPSTGILNTDKNGIPFDHRFDYQSIVVHQCACFCFAPRQLHGDGIVRLVKYLRNTREKGILIKPNTAHGLEV